MLKNRFACCDIPIRYEPLMASKIITAVGCLHNFALRRGDLWIDEGKIIDLEDEHYACHGPFTYQDPHDRQLYRIGEEVRDDILRLWFS